MKNVFKKREGRNTRSVKMEDEEAATKAFVLESLRERSRRFASKAIKW